MCQLDVGDVGCPDLIEASDVKSFEKIGVYVRTFVWFREIGLRVDRHETHEPHEAPHAVDASVNAVVPRQHDAHFGNAIDRSLGKDRIDHIHDTLVLGLVRRRVVQTLSRNTDEIYPAREGHAFVIATEDLKPFVTGQRCADFFKPLDLSLAFADDPMKLVDFLLVGFTLFGALVGKEGEKLREHITLPFVDLSRMHLVD